MTLHIGARLVKLDANGEPIKDGESYVEFEVIDWSGHITDWKYVNESTDPDKPTSNSVAFLKVRTVR